MPDAATPNLPSRDFDATAALYAQLGFECAYRGPGWMILKRGDAQLEFFPYPDLDPHQSSFGCCLRLDDLGTMMKQLEASAIQCAERGIPRYHQPRTEPSGLTITYMVDDDGSLIRIIQNG